MQRPAAVVRICTSGSRSEFRPPASAPVSRPCCSHTVYFPDIYTEAFVNRKLDLTQ